MYLTDVIILYPYTLLVQFHSSFFTNNKQGTPTISLPIFIGTPKIDPYSCLGAYFPIR